MKQIKRTEKKSFMNNVMILLLSQIGVKVLGLAYRLYITNAPGFGDAGNGYSNAGYQIYTLLLAISSVGIPNAISKKVSEKQAVGDYRAAHRIFRVSMLLFAVIGAALSLALFLGAGFISEVILKIGGAKYTLQALAPSVFFVCVSSVIRGYFLGFQNADAAAASQIIEQIFKCSLTILIVTAMIGQTPELMAAGVNVATSIATLCSFAYIYIYYKLRRRGIWQTVAQSEAKSEKEPFTRVAKAVLLLSIPIAFSSIINAVNRIIDMATVTRGIEAAFAGGIPGIAGLPTAKQLNDYAITLVGRLSKQDTLTNLPLALNIAFATALVPTVSSALAVGNKKEASKKISFSMLISVLIILPCVTGFIVLAKPIYGLIYPNASLGYELLQVYAIAMLFSAMNQTECGALQGIGRVTVPAKGLLCGSIVKFILNCTLIRIRAINVFGAAIGSVSCQFIACAYCFITLRREVGFDFRLSKYVVKPLVLNVTMGAVAWAVYTAMMKITHSNSISTIASIVLAAAYYVAALLKSGILEPDEIKALPLGDKIIKLTRGGRAE